MALPVIPSGPLTADHSTQKEKLGTLRVVHDETYGMLVYRYVKIASTSAAVANGTFVFQDDAYGRQGTTVVADATSRNLPLGVGIGTITAGNYGWLQVAGYHSAVKTNGDDDIAAGDTIIASASNGVVDSVTAGTASTYVPVGIAVAADVDAANTVAVQLRIFPLA